MTANDIMATPQASPTARLAMALAYAQRGWAVFPVFGLQDGACDCKFEHEVRYNGAHPHLGYSYRDATCDYDTIAHWFKQWPNMNFGVATGREIANNKKTLIIIEAPAVAVLSEEAITKVAAFIGNNFSIVGIVLTPQGTRHVYAEIGADHDLNFSEIKGIKVQAKEGQAWGAGSLHHTGAAYQWIGAPLDVPCLSDAVTQARTGATDDPAVATDVNKAPAAEDDNSPAVLVPNDFQATANAVTKRIAANRVIAAKYMDVGFKLCRIATGTKGPKTTGWQDNPITLDEVNHQGLGLIHALSGTCAIDLDNLESAVGWFAVRGIDLLALLAADDAVHIRSGRPNRGKLLYRLPPGITPLPLVQVKNHDGTMLIEFRCAATDGAGCQDVLPPTIHPGTGNPYRWAGAGDFKKLSHLPSDVLAIWQGLLAAPSAAITTTNAGMPPDYPMVEGGRNTALFKIGGNMARQGLSQESIRAALSIENKNRCIPPLPEAEVASIAKSAAKNSHGAKEAAARILDVHESDEDALTLAHKAAAARCLEQQSLQPKVVPSLTGIMRDIAEWSELTARKIQPAYAMGTALAACSAVLSRDFVIAGNLHTNLYSVIAGPTASGKENALATVSKIIQAYDGDRRAGKPSSDTSILTVMARNPASTFVIDELGEVLQGILDPKAPAYKKGIGTVLMDLYTKGGAHYVGTEYAIQEKTKVNSRVRVDMFSPCPSIFGATTPSTLFKGLSHDAVTSGFLPRLLPIFAPDTIPMPNFGYENAPIPASVMDWMAAIKERIADHVHETKNGKNLLGAASHPYLPIHVPYSEAAEKLFQQAQIDMVMKFNGGADEVEINMLSRVVENASRVALTMALAADPWATEVSAEHFANSLTYVTHLSEVFLAAIRANLFDSQFAKVEVKAHAYIVEYFSKHGKPVSEGILVDRCTPYGSAHAKDRNQVIRSLQAQGKISTKPGRNTDTLLYLPRG